MEFDTLVTGGNGLIGSEFTNVVRTTHQEFDLTNALHVHNMYIKYRPKAVIHTAARVGGVLANTNFVGDFYTENILINTNVIEYARIHNVEKLICFLSTCVFPDKIEYPIDETMIHQGPPHHSNFGYAYAKRMSDVQLAAYNQQFGTRYFSVIPTNVYGPRDNYNLENGHVIPSLIHRCYLAIQNNTNFEVWGSGKPLREFIFSRDVADLCQQLLTDYTDTTPVILSTSEEITIADLVMLICDKMKFKNKIIFDSNKPDGQYRKNSTNKKLLSIVGDYKFTPIDIGLEETIEHFCQNFSTIRK
jgi:GDP-L-fucose synthase